MIGAFWLSVILMFSTAASASGFNGWGTAAVLVSMALAAHTAAHQPSVTATVILLVLFAPIWVRVAVLYNLSATGSASLGTTWFVGAALAGGVAVAAHLTSRGRPWVTVLIALAAIAVAGPLTLILWPAGGFLVASGYAAVVLLVRSRAWPLIVDTILDATRELRATWGGGDGPDGIEWARGAEGEERTGAHLATLPAGFVVFHNRAVPGVKENIDHLIIGPAGVSVITSQMLSGAVTSDPELGLLFNSATMTGVLTEALNRTDQVAKGLGLRRTDVATLYVVHGATLEAPRQVVRLFNAADAFLGQVTVLAPEEVLSEVNTPLEVHSPRAVNALRRRAARKFQPFEATAPLTVPVIVEEPSDRASDRT